MAKKLTGDRLLEVATYNNLGLLLRSRGEYVAAEKRLKEALSLSKNIGSKKGEFKSLFNLALLWLSQSNHQEALSYLFQCVEKFENFRHFLKDNDQFQISFAEKYVADAYKLLSRLLSHTGNPQDALYVVELIRARALANLMAAQYSVENHISGSHQSWCGIQNIASKETNCTCLYISVEVNYVRFWILKERGGTHFLEENVNLKKNAVTGLIPDLDQFFKDTFRSLGILPEEICEDRSLDDIKPMSLDNENRALLRGDEPKDIETSLHSCYKIIIAPVADLLKEPEIIIVPDSCLYRVPFAALRDEGGKYLSETFRIRIIPSLTTLKLIQESPPDYHSQIGALIVGDPEVGLVLYKGWRKYVIPLPCARKEAEMVGRLLGVTPLIGEHATRQAVLQAIHSVSVIHIAAHGNAERGEIFLCPKHSTECIPREDDYLLTMSDISQVQLRAKLVVLSCCHSGRGDIKAEGVIGIARAFLGSGARSVLVARWALDDTATEQFMKSFYEHLSRGESASESLHEARKWMRSNGFDNVSQWSPFMLIGDNVTFDFGKQR